MNERISDKTKATMMREAVRDYNRFKETFSGFAETCERYLKKESPFEIEFIEKTETTIALKVLDKEIRVSFDIVDYDYMFFGVLLCEKTIDKDKRECIRTFFFDKFGCIAKKLTDKAFRLNFCEHDGFNYICAELVDACITKCQKTDSGDESK